MGNKIPRPFFRKPCSNDEYVETIRDANFSWLEGRRVSAADFYPMERYHGATDRVALLMHQIFKYVLKGNTSVPLTSEMTSCLHIGSGHYIWLLEMADKYREINFEGFDIAPTAESNLELRDPLPPNLHFTHGNIFDGGLPYPNESFDYVNIRCFLTWIPSDKIPFLIKEIRRVTKRGGLVEFLEMDVHMKNGTSEYENTIGKVWRDICICSFYDPKNIINLKRSIEKGFFEIKASKLSIPIGRYGGSVGDLHADVFIEGTNVLAEKIKEKLNMTHDEIQAHILKCADGLNLNQAYNNFHLVCAKKKF